MKKCFEIFGTFINEIDRSIIATKFIKRKCALQFLKKPFLNTHIVISVILAATFCCIYAAEKSSVRFYFYYVRHQDAAKNKLVC